MKIRDLNTGDTFRFPLGLATYIILSCVYTNEIGWLIHFANIKNGQLYQYTEPWNGQGKDPTESKVKRIKEKVILPDKIYCGPHLCTSNYLDKNKVEKYYNIKLSQKTITK